MFFYHGTNILVIETRMSLSEAQNMSDNNKSYKEKESRVREQKVTGMGLF